MTDRLLDITTGTAVCDLDHLAVESGAAALVDGEAVAVFRVEGDAVFALASPMDENGNFFYLVSWTDADGNAQSRWFEEAQLTAV